MYRSRTVWRPNYRMVLSAERVREPAILNPRYLEPANFNPHPGPFPSPNNATSSAYLLAGDMLRLIWIEN